MAQAFSKAPLGEGGRFAACIRRVMAFYQKKGRSMTIDRAKAICASIGRRAYGKARFQKMAVAGKKRG
jgi:hypothetical protein